MDIEKKNLNNYIIEYIDNSNLIYNPIVLCGKEDDLKDCLSNVKKEIQERNKSVLYIEDLTNIPNNNLNNDVYIIEKIDKIEDNQQAQYSFFNLFNKIYDEKKLIIITSYKDIKDLSVFEERIITRLNWGKIIKIEDNNGKLWSKRSTTIRSEYMKLVLGSHGKKLENYEKYYSKKGFDINYCVYCGEKTANALDHIFSPTRDKLFTGYTNDIENLLPTCTRCNSSKGNKDWEEWINSKTSKAAIKANNNPGIEERKEKIRKYIRDNNSEKHKLDPNVVKTLNDNCLIFEKEMKNCFSNLEKLIIEHKTAFEKAIEDNEI